MNYDDELQRLLGFALPEDRASFQAQQMPQIQQGLLGSSDAQNQNVQDVIDNGTNAAVQMAQAAQSANQALVNSNNDLAQRQAANMQAAQNGTARQQQQPHLLFKLARMFIGA